MYRRKVCATRKGGRPCFLVLRCLEVVEELPDTPTPAESDRTSVAALPVVLPDLVVEVQMPAQVVHRLGTDDALPRDSSVLAEALTEEVGGLDVAQEAQLVR